MNASWAAKVPSTMLRFLGAFRLREDVSALTRGASVWLAGEKAAPPELRDGLAAIPDVELFTVRDGGLVPQGKRLVVGQLPQGTWRTLRTLIAVEVQPAALAGQFESSIPLRLLRGGIPSEPSLLIADAQGWYEYAIAAPGLRLARWSFASNGSQAAILGRPLPPLQGERFVVREGLALPCGMRLQPELGAAVLQAYFDLVPGDLAVLRAGVGEVLDDYERLPSSAFVPATRANLRASFGEGAARV